MKLFILFIPFFLFANEDFISHYEYGEMLYQNPRGVSCANCHGITGKGKVIASYKEAGVVHKIVGVKIDNKSLKEITKSLKSPHKIMPKYYLTKTEIKAIYDYLQTVKKIR